MISISNKVECCGCNACGDICPRKAITFQADEEGFLYPHINHDACVNCGLCEKVCPQIHAKAVMDSISANTPTCWAAVAKDLSVRFDSSSGGMFTSLAEKILDEGGMVGGAVWGDDFRVFQIISDSKADLARLRSSKYAQSNAQGFYRAVKKAIDSGRKVFVCGTPCQMMALKLFVGEKDNLFTADFICSAVNSPLAMQKYIEMIEQKHGKKVVAVKQRCTELGWRKLTTKFTFSDGTIDYNPILLSPFMLAFVVFCVIPRPSCYVCKCKGVSRVTDLTIADCWGVIEKLDKWKFDMDLGASIVMCHTEKGRAFFESISDKLERQTISIDDIIAGSSTICKSLEKEKIDRNEFFSKLRTDGIEAAMSLAAKQPRPLKYHLRRIMRFGRRYLSSFLISPRCLWIKIRMNGLSNVLRCRPCLYPIGNVLWQAERGSQLIVKGNSVIGLSLFRGSKLESRVMLTPGSKLILHGCRFGYGCNIQLFDGATMEVGTSFYCNIGATFICKGSIKIGNDVICGRNVTIREYHGDHFINSPDYKCFKPIEIGDHVWLCEYCTIMPGVKIGSGSVVAAHSLVTHDVPPNSLVMGIPARVVRTGIQWKA